MRGKALGPDPAGGSDGLAWRQLSQSMLLLGDGTCRLLPHLLAFRGTISLIMPISFPASLSFLQGLYPLKDHFLDKSMSPWKPQSLLLSLSRLGQHHDRPGALFADWVRVLFFRCLASFLLPASSPLPVPAAGRSVHVCPRRRAQDVTTERSS